MDKRLTGAERWALILGVLALLNYSLDQMGRYLATGGWWVAFGLLIVVVDVGSAFLLARLWYRTRKSVRDGALPRGLSSAQPRSSLRSGSR